MSAAARPAAQLAAAFLTLHALVHLWDTIAGREHAHQLLIEIAPVFVPALLAIWLAWPRRAPACGGAGIGHCVAP